MQRLKKLLLIKSLFFFFFILRDYLWWNILWVQPYFPSCCRFSLMIKDDFHYKLLPILLANFIRVAFVVDVYQLNILILYSHGRPLLLSFPAHKLTVYLMKPMR